MTKRNLYVKENPWENHKIGNFCHSFQFVLTFCCCYWIRDLCSPNSIMHIKTFKKHFFFLLWKSEYRIYQIQILLWNAAPLQLTSWDRQFIWLLHKKPEVIKIYFFRQVFQVIQGSLGDHLAYSPPLLPRRSPLSSNSKDNLLVDEKKCKEELFSNCHVCIEKILLFVLAI